MLSEIGDRHERLIRRSNIRRNSWCNAGIRHMIETIVIVFAIGVFAIFATLMVLAAILLYWTFK